MPFQRNDLTGVRYGKLTVVSNAGTTRYGGKSQTLWHCVCDCGETIDLPHYKLPFSESNIRAMNRAGRLPYTSCETCRAKTCPLCGDRFPYSHPSHVCPSPLCQEEQRRWRDDFWHGVSTERYRADPEYRASVRAYQNDYYNERADEIREARTARVERLPAAEREERARRRATRGAAYYAELKNDAVRYARHRERHRERLAEQALRDLLSDTIGFTATMAKPTETRMETTDE